MAGRVEGKVALITGAGLPTGLGAADARLLAREGAHVVLTDVDAARGRDTAAAIPGALFLEQDVRDEARWAAVIAEVADRFGGLHVLVNNAGIVRSNRLEDISLDEFRLHQQIMVEGTFLGCKHAVPVMARSGGGSIVNIASIGGIKGHAGLTAYAAAKAGVIGMTRAIAVYCRENGYPIRVNSVAPGGHDSPMTRTEIAAGTHGDEAAARAQLETLGTPEDVANMVLYLASDESRRVTGALMVVDNGETIS